MCAPVAKELEYLGWYENAPPAPQCLIHRQLDALHGGEPAKARGTVKVWGEEFGNLSSMHGYEGWWMHEDNVNLTEAEEIKDWKPPAGDPVESVERSPGKQRRMMSRFVPGQVQRWWKSVVGSLSGCLSRCSLNRILRVKLT